MISTKPFSESDKMGNKDKKRPRNPESSKDDSGPIPGTRGIQRVRKEMKQKKRSS